MGSVTIAARAGLSRQGEPPQTLSFDVASVRPNNSGGFNITTGVRTLPGGSVLAENVSLRTIIAFAYGLDLHQGVEGRFGLLDENFDVIARAPADVPRAPFGSIGPLNLMMQRLLADRFRLVVRWEERLESGFALVRLESDGTTLGPGLHPSEIRCTQPAMVTGTIETPSGCAATTVVGNQANAVGRTMADIARSLSFWLRQPVLDRTGLDGSYDVRLRFNAAELAARMMGSQLTVGEAQASEAETLPSIFVAIEEQLGLALQPESVSVPALVVESVEPPTPN